MSQQGDDSKDRLNRRLFLNQTFKALATVGSFELLPKTVQASTEDDNKKIIYKHGLSILQGLTTANYTQISVDIPRGMAVKYRFFDAYTGKDIQPDWQKSEIRAHSSWQVDQLAFSGLTYPGYYYLRVTDQFGTLLDERTLCTLDLNRKDVRIGVASCMLDWSSDKDKMWDAVESAGPDIMFMIGDNVYGDVAGILFGPELLWRRYIETRRRLKFYHMRHLIPTVAIWDDHDFGCNNGNGHYRYKEDSLKTFKAFFPQRELNNVYWHGPGASSRFQAFGHNFMFMDNRYFRDVIEAGQIAFWGQQQCEWAFQHLQEATMPTWFIQGSQFFGGFYNKGQSYESFYKNEMSRVLTAMGQLNAPVMFLSGDVHFTELMNIEKEHLGYQTYEITSSSLHSFHSSGAYHNPRREEVKAGHHFVFIDLLPSHSVNAYQVTCVNQRQTVDFSTELILS